MTNETTATTETAVTWTVIETLEATLQSLSECGYHGDTQLPVACALLQRAVDEINEAGDDGHGQPWLLLSTDPIDAEWRAVLCAQARVVTERLAAVRAAAVER